MSNSKHANLVEAAKAVILNYADAQQERHDELRWDAFNGVNRLLNALEDLGGCEDAIAEYDAKMALGQNAHGKLVPWAEAV